MNPIATPFQGMEDALRDACERAIQNACPFPTLLRLYRSVLGLSRALMQARIDIGLSPRLSEASIELLDAVRDAIGLQFPHPELPTDDALRLHSAMAALARIAHKARTACVPAPAQTTEQHCAPTEDAAGEPDDSGDSVTRHLIHREKPPASVGLRKPDFRRPPMPDNRIAERLDPERTDLDRGPERPTRACG